MQCIKRLSKFNKIKPPPPQSNKFSVFANSAIINSSPKNRISNQFPLATSLFDQRLISLSTVLNYSSVQEEELIDPLTFERVCEETLESLTEYFEELVEQDPDLQDADVNYSSGVLTISFGKPHGTYVINKQSPNRQIWLSSPTSGPKRYDFVTTDNFWVYKHTGETLHHLLQQEIPAIVKANVDFKNCANSKI